MRKIKIPINFPQRLKSKWLKDEFDRYIESSEFTRLLNHDEVKFMFGTVLNNEHIYVISPENLIGTIVDISYDENDYLMATIHIDDTVINNALIDIIEKYACAMPIIAATFDYDTKSYKITNIIAYEPYAFIRGEFRSTYNSFHTALYYNRPKFVRALSMPPVKIKRKDNKDE